MSKKNDNTFEPDEEVFLTLDEANDSAPQARRKLRPPQKKSSRGAAFWVIGCLAAGLGGMLILAVGVAVLMFSAPSNPKNTVDSPEKDALRMAELKVLGSSAGAAQGNDKAARELAARFSQTMGAIDKVAFSKSKAKVKLTGGNYITWCELHPDRVAFVVHVPELRRFTSDAKDALARIAWAAAQGTVEGSVPPGSRLAVGLRGVLLYDRILLGEVSAEGEANLEEVDDGMKAVFQTSHDRDDLVPFFQTEDREPDTLQPESGQEEP